MATAFQERLAAMRKTIDAAKKNIDAGGFADVPPGVFVGTLEQLEPGLSKKDKAQVTRGIRILEGDESGLVCKDWLNVEHEVGLAITCQFIQQHGYACEPSDVFDFVASEKSGKLVFAQEFLKVCMELETAGPQYRFEVSKRPGSDGTGRMFTDVNILEVISEGVAQAAAPTPAPAPVSAARNTPSAQGKAGTSKVQPKAQTRAPAAPAVVQEQPEADPELEALIDFANRQNVDVSDGMSVEEIVAAIGAFEYPMVGCTDEQLVDMGYVASDINHDSFITDEEAEILVRNGMDGCVIRPKAKTPAPARRMARK